MRCGHRRGGATTSFLEPSSEAAGDKVKSARPPPRRLELRDYLLPALETGAASGCFPGGHTKLRAGCVTSDVPPKVQAGVGAAPRLLRRRSWYNYTF